MPAAYGYDVAVTSGQAAVRAVFDSPFNCQGLIAITRARYGEHHAAAQHLPASTAFSLDPRIEV